MMLELLDVDGLVEHRLLPLKTDPRFTGFMLAEHLECEILFLLVIVVFFVVDLHCFDQF
jgi:hypothetical protein